MKGARAERRSVTSVVNSSFVGGGDVGRSGDVSGTPGVSFGGVGSVPRPLMNISGWGWERNWSEQRRVRVRQDHGCALPDPV